MELSGHEKGVADALFEASGRWVVTRSWDETVRIWDARSGTPLHKLAHPNPITAFAVADEGSAIVSATKAGQVFVWDATSGERRWALSHKAYVNATAIAPGGRLMATASDDRTAAVWDLQTGEQQFRWEHDDEVWSVAMDADTRTLVTGGKDRLVRFFDLASGRELRRLRLDGSVTSLAFHPASNALAAGIKLSEHQQAWTEVAIVDRKTRAPVSRFSRNGGFRHLAFSPDGRTLATTTFGTDEIKLWDVASGTLRSALEAKAKRVFFTPDGARLVTDPGSGEAFLLDAETGHSLAAIGERGGIEDFGLGPDGRTLTTFGSDGWFRGWDALTGKELWQQKKASGGEHTDLGAAGRRFATRSADGSAVEVYEAKDGHLIASIPLMPPEPLFTLSADGRRLLFIRIRSLDDKPSHEVELWDVDRRERVLRRQLPIGTPDFVDTGDRAMILDPVARSAELVDCP